MKEEGEGGRNGEGRKNWEWESAGKIGEKGEKMERRKGEGQMGKEKRIRKDGIQDDRGKDKGEEGEMRTEREEEGNEEGREGKMGRGRESRGREGLREAGKMRGGKRRWRREVS